MSKPNVNVKVTKNGEILRLKTMFEVIDMAAKALKDKNFSYGKAVVVFRDKKCNTITYVPHNIMPMPYTIKDIEPKQFDKVYKQIVGTLKNAYDLVIPSKGSIYEPLQDEGALAEIRKIMNNVK